MKVRRPAVDLLAAELSAVGTLTACGATASGEKPDSAASTASDAPATTATAAADEAVVRRLLDQIDDAWTRGDATAYASFHTPDADLIDFRGIHVVGRKGIIDLLRPAFDGVPKTPPRARSFLPLTTRCRPSSRRGAPTDG